MNPTLPSPFELTQTHANAAILATFGETVSVLVEGKTISQRGVYQCPVQATDTLGGKVNLINRSIAFDAAAFQASNIQTGDLCTVRGVVYTLLNPTPDGNGFIVCDLREYAE